MVQSVFILSAKVFGSPCPTNDDRDSRWGEKEKECNDDVFGLSVGGTCSNDKCVCQDKWVPTNDNQLCRKKSKFSYFFFYGNLQLFPEYTCYID